jgi:hypothetical protein
VAPVQAPYPPLHTESQVTPPSGFVSVTPHEPSPMHVIPDGHVAPHAPQLFESPVTSMHTPLQSASP